ncbi:CBS domain-containing protein [Legionella donaldsonii]|uniref:CBS domain-containing protein n=1 Tax=Legionella donaldsonii TaxID=45060 RepID=UPI00399C6FB6
MKVREIMRDNSVYCLPDNTIFDVAKLMEKLRIAVMPIVVNEGLLGVITLRDIVENLQKNAVTGNMAASKLMKRNVYCCYEEDDLGFVAEKIGNLQTANLIVLNNEQNKAPTGVISLANLARHTLFLEKIYSERQPKTFTQTNIKKFIDHHVSNKNY